jgi:DNA-binding HxlR family transcriptional regulator
VLWELRDGSAVTFRELQARCDDISSSVLNDRLRELRQAGIIALPRNGGYRLTQEGEALLDALVPIDAWARRWARRRPIP